eukprot:15236161-Alexandrium_andersonii.AAC.1
MADRELWAPFAAPGLQLQILSELPSARTCVQNHRSRASGVHIYVCCGLPSWAIWLVGLSLNSRCSRGGLALA